MIRYNFVFKNLKRVASSIEAGSHVKGANCYWLIPATGSAVVVVPYQFITGGSFKDLSETSK